MCFLNPNLLNIPMDKHLPDQKWTRFLPNWLFLGESKVTIRPGLVDRNGTPL